MFNVILREAVLFTEVDYRRNWLYIDPKKHNNTDGKSFVGNHTITLELIERVGGV